MQGLSPTAAAASVTGGIVDKACMDVNGLSCGPAVADKRRRHVGCRWIRAGSCRPNRTTPEEHTMSLMKWTLALAGTAMGLRYMSDRHRKRLASDSHGDSDSDGTSVRDIDGASVRDPQIDRDSATAWSAPQGGGGVTGMGSGGMGSGLGTSGGATGAKAGTGAAKASTDAAAADTDDLLAPGSDLAPSGPSNRF